ncbi:MAG TPA: hypothetical protein VK821_00710 [Dehalococcoidia bacterium]|nr:hypothetical protein [Dehalococcoidia bacterium]
MTELDGELDFRMVVVRTELVDNGARVHLSEYEKDAKTDLDVLVGKNHLAGFVVGQLFTVKLIPHERQG